jgi:hypothetical protein
LAEAREKIENLKKKIGQLIMDNDFLKKNCCELLSLCRSELFYETKIKQKDGYFLKKAGFSILIKFYETAVGARNTVIEFVSIL